MVTIFTLIPFSAASRSASCVCVCVCVRVGLLARVCTGGRPRGPASCWSGGVASEQQRTLPHGAKEQIPRARGQSADGRTRPQRPAACGRSAPGRRHTRRRAA
jgi:hypothetical protein